MIHLFVTTNYHTGSVATLLCALRCKVATPKYGVKKVFGVYKIWTWISLNLSKSKSSIEISQILFIETIVHK